jgi:hypothetical protein
VLHMDRDQMSDSDLELEDNLRETALEFESAWKKKPSTRTVPHMHAIDDIPLDQPLPLDKLKGPLRKRVDEHYKVLMENMRNLKHCSLDSKGSADQD